MTDDDADPIALTVAGNRAPHVHTSMLTLEPGTAIDYRKVGWPGALVIVEQGDLEIECTSGARAHFPAGSVLTFEGLDLRSLRNTGHCCLILHALSRRT
jgi:hypothetical protein